MDNKEIIGGIGTYAHFAYGFVRQARPKIILEIGLGESGWGADAILKALDENKQEGFQEDCQYYCIDKFPTKISIDILNKYNHLATLLVGDSGDPSLYKLPSVADIVFIDGDHSFNHCVKDTINVLMNNQLSIDGVLVFHDIWMCAVRQAIKKLADEFNLNILHLKTINVCLATFRI